MSIHFDFEFLPCSRRVYAQTIEIESGCGNLMNNDICTYIFNST